MKKMMIRTMVLAVGAFAVVCANAEMESGNVVGYETVTLHHGFQTFNITFRSMNEEGGYCLSNLLASAVKGDKVMFKGTMATAKPKTNSLSGGTGAKTELHWYNNKGVIVDGLSLPTSPAVIRYLRPRKEETQMTLAGEVVNEVIVRLYEGGEELFSAPLEQMKPVSVQKASANRARGKK